VRTPPPLLPSTAASHANPLLAFPFLASCSSSPGCGPRRPHARLRRRHWRTVARATGSMRTTLAVRMRLRAAGRQRRPVGRPTTTSGGKQRHSVDFWHHLSSSHQTQTLSKPDPKAASVSCRRSLQRRASWWCDMGARASAVLSRGDGKLRLFPFII
jgi:hypothetical protein